VPADALGKGEPAEIFVVEVDLVARSSAPSSLGCLGGRRNGFPIGLVRGEIVAQGAPVSSTTRRIAGSG
jgi:hypothetical protein